MEYQPEKSVTVFGASLQSILGPCVEGNPLWKISEELGFKLAEKGFDVATGGYMGTMEAVSKGAHQYNQENPESQVKITGFVVSDLFRWRTQQGNDFLNNTVDSKTLMERLTKLVEHSSYFVVLPGQLGTALEINLIWNKMECETMYRQNYLSDKQKEEDTAHEVKAIFAWKNPWKKYCEETLSILNVNEKEDVKSKFFFVESVEEIIELLSKMAPLKK